MYNTINESLKMKKIILIGLGVLSITSSLLVAYDMKGPVPVVPVDGQIYRECCLYGLNSEDLNVAPQTKCWENEERCNDPIIKKMITQEWLKNNSLYEDPSKCKYFASFNSHKEGMLVPFYALADSARTNRIINNLQKCIMSGGILGTIIAGLYSYKISALFTGICTFGLVKLLPTYKIDVTYDINDRGNLVVKMPQEYYVEDNKSVGSCGQTSTKFNTRVSEFAKICFDFSEDKRSDDGEKIPYTSKLSNFRKEISNKYQEIEKAQATNNS